MSSKHRPSGSAGKRLTGPRWYERRKRMLAANPLCALCSVEDRVTAAQVIDHAVPLERLEFDDELACWTLCKTCHDLKTLHERGVQTVGDDGWPTSTLTPRQVQALEQRIAAYEASRK